MKDAESLKRKHCQVEETNEMTDELRKQSRQLPVRITT